LNNLRGLAWETEELVAAVPKGHLADDALDTLDKAGFDTAEVRSNHRRQFFPEARIMNMRPSDVVKYVEAGVADIGIVGKDVIEEYAEAVYELLDLEFGGCKMVLATLAGEADPVKDALQRLGSARIATKFPRTALAWSERSAQPIELVELKGSVELAPVAGLADGIIDLVDTGKTLEENHLVVRSEIGASTARLICNQISYLRKSKQISSLLALLEPNSSSSFEGNQ
jgi:ATP phosphoribosyltransferase